MKFKIFSSFCIFLFWISAPFVFGNCEANSETILKCSKSFEKIIENETHLIQPDSQSVQFCRFEIAKSPETCQVRLDFIQFELQLGETDGDCENYLLISGILIGPLCGNLGGQHLYLEFGFSEKILMDFYISKPGQGQKWDIKVTFVECYSPILAPPGCSQYFTDPIGIVQSFNFAPNNGQHLNSQDYSICIANNNFRTITWKSCSVNNSFVIAGIPQPWPKGGNPIPPTDLLTWKDSDCIFDWVEIFGVGKFCGNNFLEQKATMRPFMLGVHFNEWEIPTSPGRGVICGVNGALPCSISVDPYLSVGLPTDDINTGFCLMYQLEGFSRNGSDLADPIQQN